jgi:methionyl-tRNA synthetase
MATYEDFKKIELKVGEIKEVEDHPNADKLYILKVDTGEERTLVAGVKKHYSKEELIGKKIIVVCNLEEKELKGIKSQGMLLAASDNEKENVALLIPKNNVSNSSEVILIEN